jgi:uncharacterized protein GlcG (DUF336 family)
MTRLALAAALAVAPFAVAHAQVSRSGYVLPLALAVEAAEEAVRVCEAHGYAVTATVVDVSGVQKVVLRGDHSTIHTRDTSFRKAYTVVTMGPIFQFDVTSKFVELVAKYPGGAGQALATTPNVVGLAGGAGVKVGDEIVAGLGVGGSPGGDKDEACAVAGVAKIRDRLPH